MKNVVFVLSVVVLFSIQIKLNAQNSDASFDVTSDTLVVIGSTVVDKAKLLIDRQELLSIDTLLINQKGFEIVSFEMNALTLGVNDTFVSESSIITDEMKNALINEKKSYKFIYLKNILLQDVDGKQYKPSIESMKIVFKN